MACDKNKNPLQHGGTSQQERLLPALKPSSAKVDERTYSDWIVFANEFAAFLKYFDETNTEAGNWSKFFASDISSILGSIAIQDIDDYRQQIKERSDFIKDDDNSGDLEGLETKLNELFSGLFTLAKSMDEYYYRIPPAIGLKNTLLNLIKTKLATTLKRLIGYYKAAPKSLLPAVPDFEGWKVLNKPVADAGAIIEEGLSKYWITDNSVNWQDYANNILPDESIFISPLGTDEYLKIGHAAFHNLFNGIFDQFLFAYANIVKDASAALRKTITEWDSHQPHYALFLAFLRLFKLLQKQLNTITRAHLNFYYKRVLRLKPRNAEANQVHVLAELAKQVESYLLESGTTLKAGKDSGGKDVVYALDSDATFNKAKVSQLKNIYIGNNSDNIAGQANAGRLFAAPVSNSDDGVGAPLTSVNKEWHPYVHKIFKDGALQQLAMPEAQIGFAIASHYLYLTEGERKVFIRLAPNNSLLNNRTVACYLTTEKGWYAVDATIQSTNKKFSDNTTACAEIFFTLTGDVPPVVNYNAAIHGGTFNVNLPLIKILLKHNDSVPYDYNALKNITVQKVEVRVEVGMDSGNTQSGLKNLLLSNDFGIIDASKPFMSFGPQPTPGNRLVIGNKEIFTKNNLAVNLNIEWKDVPPKRADISYKALSGEGNYPDIDIKYLEKGIWKVLSSGEIFEDSGVEGVKDTKQLIIASGSNINHTVKDYTDDYLAYSINENQGFIALQLKESFGHKEYLNALTIYLINKANGIADKDNPKPTEPYLPVMQSLYLGYAAYQNVDLTATTQSSFNSREISFFHIYPFGETEQHQYINNLNQGETQLYLLPQFKHFTKDVNNNTVVVQHTGEFYIGIENLQPQQSVNILFQVMEGTADPLTPKPPDHIQWGYLSNNQWRNFQTQDISDATLALLQSGIISFAIPVDATSNNNLLPPGYIWLRASIATAPGAVCKLLTADAQAAVASFIPNDNADDFLASPLPEATISKLKVPDAAVKKINQPYASFGGRPKENPKHFYMRVSERLRHKQRAITIWDYEHMILEAFPEIYKVKCLNHTSVEEVSDISRYNDVKPGNVVIITIPVLTSRNDANPLKPYTSQDTLTKIETYLQQRVSCFVTVKARQPQFEEVRLSFGLKLHEAYKDFTFYSNMLKEAVTNYLTPWANNAGNDIQFGGNIYKSSLINFIEEQCYVDYIKNVQMFVTVIDPYTNNITESKDVEEVVASTTRSILISVPAVKHAISEIKETNSTTGIECFDINLVRRNNAL